MILPVLYRCRQIWLHNSKAFQLPFKQYYRVGQRHICTSTVSLSSSPTNSAGSKSEDFQSKLIKAQKVYQGDAYMRILSSPMRRCQATMLVLPKLMMFKIVPFEAKDRKPFPVPELWKAEEDSLRRRTTEEEGERPDRWYKRQSKALLLKRLERESRMLQHKAVTSTTFESRKRFEDELKLKKKQIEYWKYETSSKGKFWEIEGVQKDLEKIRLGPAWWCTLNVDAALALWSKKNQLKSSYPNKEEFFKRIGQTLEQEVIGSIAFLQKQYEDGTTRDVIKNLDIESDFQNMTDDETKVAAIILSSMSSISVISAKVKDHDNSPPIFPIDQLFDKGFEDAVEFLKALQTFTKSNSAEQTYLIKQHPSTVNLCLSLWRLKVWRDSLSNVQQE